MGQKSTPKSPHPIKVGILGCANIAKTSLIDPAQRHPDVIVYSVAARDAARARTYAATHAIQKVHQSYDELIVDPDVDAVYIPLPNSLHFEWCKRAIEAGKHVLCEKPVTSNADEAQELHTILLNCAFPIAFVEAFHYRYHPAAHRVKQLVDDIGPLEKVHVVMDVPALFLPGNMNTDIRFKSNLAGGATMDMGCYCVSALHYFGGDIKSVSKAVASYHPTDKEIDIAMQATCTYVSGAQASFYCGFVSTVLPTIKVTIKGEKGTITYNNFVRPDIFHSITYTPKQGSTKTETAYGTAGWSTYMYQLDQFCEAVRNAKQGNEVKILTGIDDSLKIMTVIDGVYEAAGMKPRMKYV